MVKCRKFFPRYIFAYMLFAPVVVALVVFLYVFCVHSTVKSATVFNVVRGDSVTGVANRLAKNSLIDSKDAFVALIRFNGGTIQAKADIKGSFEKPEFVGSANADNINILIKRNLQDFSLDKD